MSYILILLSLLSSESNAFQAIFSKKNSFKSRGSTLYMIELEANSATYAAMFVVTIIPSLAFGINISNISHYKSIH